MRSRSTGGVLLAGVGAAAVLSVSGATPAMADPTPSTSPSDTTPPPSDTPTPTPPPDTPTPTPDPTPTPTPTPTDPPTDPPTETPTPTPTDPPTGTPTPTPTPTPTDPGGPSGPGRLAVELSATGTTVRPGGSIRVTAHYWSLGAASKGAVLRVTAPGATVRPAQRSIGTLGAGGGNATVTVSVPADADPRAVRVTATVSASGAKAASRSFTLVVTDPSGTVPADLAALTSTLDPGAPSPGVPTGLPSTVPGLLGDIRAPQVALPPVASPQVAPLSNAIAPMSSLRGLHGDASPIEELGALQAGVLAALGSAVTLALLRIRLARRAGPPPARVYGRTYGRVDGRGRPSRHGVRVALLPAEPPRPSP
ncbi:hypothetical protein [Actinomadura sp. LOL_011]|uniref:hypothetical protein n=1 Tax=Actinomadura sp. LOL_011 TaxID=3345410 RepID=UPI003A80B8FC